MFYGTALNESQVDVAQTSPHCQRAPNERHLVYYGFMGGGGLRVERYGVKVEKSASVKLLPTFHPPLNAGL